MGERKDDPDGSAIAQPLERLARLLRAQEHAHGLNPAQWEALRYLARANRFSNSPTALTRYLGATKGTISQTVMALVRKGLVTKAARGGGTRALALGLTPAGQATLADDPWARVSKAADALGGKTRRRAARALRELLSGELRSGGHGSFGICASCRYFRDKGRSEATDGPHLCMLFEAPLSRVDAERICIAHEDP